MIVRKIKISEIYLPHLFVEITIHVIVHLRANWTCRSSVLLVGFHGIIEVRQAYDSKFRVHPNRPWAWKVIEFVIQFLELLGSNRSMSTFTS